MKEQPSTSTNSEQDPPRDARKKTPRWRTLLRVLLVAILALLAVRLLAGWASRARIQKAWDDVASEGQSLRYSDFAPPDVAEGENATDFLEAAGSLLAAKKAREASNRPAQVYQRLREIDRHRQAVTPEDLELFRRAVERHDLVLRVLDEGMPCHRARFDVFYHVRNPSTLEIPNLMRRLRLAALVRARAWLAADDGRPGDAWGEVARLFRLASWHADEMPTVIHVLIADNIARQGLATAETLMQVATPSAEEMALVVAEARLWDPHATLGRALQAERASTFATMLDERGWKSMVGGISPLRLNLGPLPLDVSYAEPLATWPFRPWIHWNAAVFSDAMSEMIAACEPPAYRRREVPPGRFGELFLPPRWAVLARMVMPNLIESCGRRDVLAAHLDLMEIAFRLEEHRRETGAYPPSLDLLGDVPAVDPFSGGPYRYRPDAGAAVVYSVGGNGADDGGTPPAPGGVKSTPELHDGDIVWRLP